MICWASVAPRAALSLPTKRLTSLFGAGGVSRATIGMPLCIASASTGANMAGVRFCKTMPAGCAARAAWKSLNSAAGFGVVGPSTVNAMLPALSAAYLAPMVMEETGPPGAILFPMMKICFAAAAWAGTMPAWVAGTIAPSATTAPASMLRESTRWVNGVLQFLVGRGERLHV